MRAVAGSVLVVGTGLIGTSVGLALQDTHRVLLHDRDQGRLAEAVGRGAGLAWDGSETVDLALVAIPPARTAAEIVDLQRRGVAATFTHVASCQSQVQRDLEAQQADLTRICGGHPLAGRETSGPGGATAQLFLARPWVVCALPTTAADASAAVTALAVACRAEPLTMAPDEHDRAVALSSHLPQMASSALAAALLSSDARSVSVSGPGLQDTTRIAASDPDLWTEVLAANAAHVAPLVGGLAQELHQLHGALERLARGPDAEALRQVRDVLTRGNEGRSLVPVKRGVRDRDVTVVAVRVTDEPGQLAHLLVRAAAADVNVEDVHVEHLPGRHTGVVELLVRQADAGRLAHALSLDGLEVIEGSP